EIVSHEKAAVEKVFAKGFHFGLIKVHGAGLDHVNERKAKEIGIGKTEDAAIGIDLQRSDLLKAIGEVDVAVREIGETVARFTGTVPVTVVTDADKGKNILLEAGGVGPARELGVAMWFDLAGGANRGIFGNRTFTAAIALSHDNAGGEQGQRTYYFAELHG